MKNKWLKYNSGIGKYKNWIIEEKEFNFENQGKFEAIFALGNGYIGSRASLEEEYPNRHSGMYVSSTFNSVQGPEVPELPNSPNLWEIDLNLDGKEFNQLVGKLKNYKRYLNIKDALLVRELNWISPEGKEYYLKFERFISLNNKHLLNQKLTIVSKQDSLINIKSGINAQETSSGAQHFEDYNSTYKDNVLSYTLKTTNSSIFFVINKTLKVLKNGKNLNYFSRLSSVYGYNRRKLLLVPETFSIKKDEKIELEWTSNIHTTRDLGGITDLKKLNTLAHKEILKESTVRFNSQLNLHKKSWKEIWDNRNIEIDTKEDWDILSTRWATYQVARFTPSDYRSGIDAKAWSGEEYKGHNFWDTEIYIWPYYLYTNPKIARNLLKGRYYVMNSGFIKAKKFKEKGLFWPWETSWKDDGETCPTWGAVDKITGERIKVWPAYNQIHIGGCIGWAISKYFESTNDQMFMNKYGYEMIFANSIYWANRFEYNKTKDFYELTKVTGPNEYKENIDNNAFTNYMAWNVLEKAVKYYEDLATKNNDVFHRLDKKYNLLILINKLIKIKNKIYLPKPNKNLIIPENDTFLSLPEIDNIFYRENSDKLWKKYTFPELNNYQTLKQGDVVSLLYTLENMFTEKEKIANWKFYEDRCLHHSSLSYCIHAVTASYSNNRDKAYDFFVKSTNLDIGIDMKSCDNGVHAANTGGILKIIIEGFLGIKVLNKKLYLRPLLPKEWKSVKSKFWFNGIEFEYKLSKTKLTVIKLSLNKKKTKVIILNKEYIIEDKLEVNL